MACCDLVPSISASTAQQEDCDECNPATSNLRTESVLILGDGDFSYSLSRARHPPPSCQGNCVAWCQLSTSFDSIATLQNKCAAQCATLTTVVCA